MVEELEVLGYTRGEYVRQNVMKSCPDSSTTVLNIFQSLGSGNTISDVPARFRTKAGKIQDLLIDSNVNFNDNGEFQHARSFIRDDAGRYNRETRAEVAKDMSHKIAAEKLHFAARIVHEIKAPIHVLAMILSSEEKRENAQRQVKNIKRLVSNVIAAMNVEDGHVIAMDRGDHSVRPILQTFEETVSSRQVLTRGLQLRTRPLQIRALT